MNKTNLINPPILVTSVDDLQCQSSAYDAQMLLESKKQEKENQLKILQEKENALWRRVLRAAKREFMKRPPWQTAVIVFFVGCSIVIGLLALWDTAYNKYDRERAYWKNFVDTKCGVKLSDIDIDPEMAELTRKRCHKYTPYVNQSTTRYMVSMFIYTIFEWFWIAFFWLIVHWLFALFIFTCILIVYYIFQPQIHLIIRMPFNLFFPKKNKDE